jgi:hypothetical protein
MSSNTAVAMLSTNKAGALVRQIFAVLQQSPTVASGKKHVMPTKIVAMSNKSDCKRCITMI